MVTLTLPELGAVPGMPSQLMLAELVNVFSSVVYESSVTLVTIVSRTLVLTVSMAYLPLASGVMGVSVPQEEPFQACHLAERKVRPADVTSSVMTALFSVAPMWLAVMVQVIVRFFGS